MPDCFFYYLHKLSAAMRVQETDPGLSWSLDINVAKRFYRGALLSAEIEKQQIIALFEQNTCEEEVLVNLNKSQITQIA